MNESSSWISVFPRGSFFHSQICLSVLKVYFSSRRQAGHVFWDFRFFVKILMFSRSLFPSLLILGEIEVYKSRTTSVPIRNAYVWFQKSSPNKKHWPIFCRCPLGQISSQATSFHCHVPSIKYCIRLLCSQNNQALVQTAARQEPIALSCSARALRGSFPFF